jgi:integrase
MNELIVVEKLAEWQRLKALVLDSVSSPITRRVYNMALDEFIAWYHEAPRPGFTKATVSAWRVSLEARGLGSSSIIIRMSAIRKLAIEAADNGLLAPELAAGIVRVKSAKSIGIRVGNWLSLRQAQALLSAPDIATVKGLRDRAILAVLLGCGLRRSEVPALTFSHVQQRDGRWFPLQHFHAAAADGGVYALIDPCPRNCRNLRQINRVESAAHNITVLLPDAPIEFPLPFVNLMHSSGISDLNHSAHFSRRVHSASRFTEATGVVLVRNDEEAVPFRQVQFDSLALEDGFQRFGRFRVGRTPSFPQHLPGNLQVVAHAAFLTTK